MTEKKSDIVNCDHPARMTVFKIQSAIEAIEKNSLLHEERNFDKRVKVIDFIGFHIIDQIEILLQKSVQPVPLILLKHRAEKIRSELEAIDANLFKKLQSTIRMEGCRGEKFKNLVNQYFSLDYNEHQEEIGYDNLDVFINGLLLFQPMPEQTKDLEPEMVYYQKTPARIIFELVEKCHFTKKDVFFDLGSGLGQVAILVNLLAAITVKGVEVEPAFCDYARDCAVQLGLSNITFINVDARKADYSEGTIFFMFTPFSGKIMQEVLEVLRKESLLRKIKIITYGPCTDQVALQSWLYPAAPNDGDIYKPGVFTSL